MSRFPDGYDISFTLEGTEDNVEAVTDFLDAIPNEMAESIESIGTISGSLSVLMHDGASIGSRYMRQVIPEGWVVTSHCTDASDKNRFFFRRLDFTEQEIERTITETVERPTVKSINHE